MDPLITSAIISGAASTVNTGANAAMSGIKNKRSLKNTKDLAEFQNRLNLANWQRQNAYNSPAAQMNRLKIAGLNPNLIYQNGGAMASAGELPSPSLNQFDYQIPELSSPVESFNSTLQTLKNNDLVQAQIDKLVEEKFRMHKENDTMFQPLKEVHNLSLLNQEEKDYYARLFGMTPTQVNELSPYSLLYMTQLKSAAQNNENAKKTYEILNHNVGTAENDALRAKFVAMMEMMNTYTEARKHGWKVGYVESFTGARDGAVMNLFRDSKAVDYVFETFLREYKELKWQSSDAKHIFDTANQSIGSVSGAYSNFKPTSHVTNTYNNMTIRDNYQKR